MLLGLPHLEVAGWGGIYSHQPKCSRWRRLLAMGAPDSPVRHRTVSGAPPRHLVVRPLSWSTVGDFVLMWHRTVRCHTGQFGAPLTAALTSAAVLFIRQSRPLRADSRCSAGAPDSPVNYSGAAPGKPEGEEFDLIHSGAPDTVRWHTGRSGAPDQGNLRFPFCSFLLRPNLFF
jgi:hypothetical protein|uniref:Uncharacterized protein n=1 Tax=Zea mays TaxID=4577 RepID=C0HHA3_MAIZE|nr:unknown [Zea mays]